LSRRDKKMMARKVNEGQKQPPGSLAVVPAAAPAEQVTKSAPISSPSPERKVKEQEPAILPLLLSVSQVCALLNVSRSTLFRLEKSGEIPGRVTLGGQVRYHRQVIEEWLLELAKGQEGKGNDSI
jgi:excisionase family DNA binding protein